MIIHHVSKASKEQSEKGTDIEVGDGEMGGNKGYDVEQEGHWCNEKRLREWYKAHGEMQNKVISRE